MQDLFAAMLKGFNFHLHDCCCVQKSCSRNISPNMVLKELS